MGFNRNAGCLATDTMMWLLKAGVGVKGACASFVEAYYTLASFKTS